MASIAVWHIGIAGRRYTPGEVLPKMSREETERLTALGAIRTDSAADSKPQTSADFKAAHADSTGGKKPESETEEPCEDEEDEELPEIDAQEGIVDEEEDAPIKKKRARG